MGEYDSEMEFCTVKLILSERGKPKPISLLHRLKAALEWTIKYYLLALGILFMACLTSLVMISLFEKLKVIPMLFEEKVFPHREDQRLDQ